MKRILSDDVDVRARSDDTILCKGLGHSADDDAAETTPWILLEGVASTVASMKERDLRMYCQELGLVTSTAKTAKKAVRKLARHELAAAIAKKLKAHRAAEPDAPRVGEALPADVSMGLDASEPWTTGGISDSELNRVIDRDPAAIASLPTGGKDSGYEVVVHAPAALGSTGATQKANMQKKKARKSPSRSLPRKSSK